ncbi:hypothetical protein SAY87_020328 [Trapa incisa]|uniref:Uncharacterized protein n=1 Tax=Trapa incisa TaxID=236973 RepID=A0AAN7K3S4_9MYRT|nr:hypothetical protein SAY87_020328 [Trapa incisa]
MINIEYIGSLKLIQEEISAPQLVVLQVGLEGRIDLETNDYPDPGPNRGHDPKVPGAA